MTVDLHFGDNLDSKEERMKCPKCGSDMELMATGTNMVPIPPTELEPIKVIAELWVCPKCRHQEERDPQQKEVIPKDEPRQ